MALSNLLENSGYKVTKEYYVNDAGRQISILTSSILLKAYAGNFDVEGMYEGDYIHEIAQEFLKDNEKIDINLDLKGLSDDKEKKLDQISEYFQKNHKEAWKEANDFSITKILNVIKEESYIVSISFMITGFMRVLLDLFKTQVLIYQNHYLLLKRLDIHFLKMVLSGLKLQTSKTIRIGFC